MKTMILPRIRTKPARTQAGEPTRSRNVWAAVVLAAIVLLAGALRFGNLSALGYANSYYTAAVTAMLRSWHNFFFVAAEPGGAVSVDKPPVGLWLQVASASVFGVNTIGVLLPQLLAGMASVVLLYHLVQRRFGQLAGLVAGLALAITPVAVATDRNNTMDSTLVLTLLLAAWAFIKATESGRPRYLLVGAGLVGIGFNIKMLQAYLPLPAFYALYFFGASDRILRKIGKLGAATVLLLAISLSWITIVDLTPPSQRPYVGGSGTNSAWNLAIGYNGLQRLLGQGASLGALASGRGPFTGFAPPGNGGGQGPPDGGRGGPGNSLFGGWRGGPGGGAFGTGQPGPLRLFTGSMSNEMSWLLPFGLFSAVLLALRSRLRWPLSKRHGAIVLWGGWLLTGGVFFSIAGFFHPYYLTTLAPPLAALVGLGVAELWQLRQTRWWLALGLSAVAVAGSAAYQYRTALNFTKAISWLPLVVGLCGAGVALSVLARDRWQRTAGIGFASLVAALLITPGIWSGLTTLYSRDSLPSAYNGGRGGWGMFGRDGGPGYEVDQTLLAYLQAHTQGMKYLMAVPSSNQGAGYVIATGRPVLYLGGFGGQDPVETADSLAKLVAAGELRYIYEGGPRRMGDQFSITSWVANACTAVHYNTGSGGSQASGRGPGLGPGTLYDCKT